MNSFATLEPYLNEKIYHNMKEKCIDNAKTIQDLKNMMEYIDYNKDKYLDKNEKNDDDFLLPVRKGTINVVYNKEIEGFIEKFCLNSNDIASNIELIRNKENYSKLLHPPTPDITLTDMCQKMKIEGKERTDFTNNVCNLFAKEMMCHPYIKEFVYEYLRNSCYVSTMPTEEGEKQLDVFHPSYRTKRITERPIKTFGDDLFLDVYQREQEKLIKINIEIKQDPESMKVFRTIFTQALNSEQNNFDSNLNSNNNIGIKQEKNLLNDDNDNDNDYNYSTQNKSEWYVLRENIIKIFIESISKQFLIDIKKELKEKSENFVIKSCAEYFDKLLMTAPYIKSTEDDKVISQPENKLRPKKKKDKKNNEDGDYEENMEIENEPEDPTDSKFKNNEIPRVMVFVFDSNKGLTYAIALNKNGEKIDQKNYQFQLQLSRTSSSNAPK